MKREANQLSAFDAVISSKTLDLLLLRSDTWDFLETEHSIKEAKARLKEARASGKEVSAIAVALVKYKDANPSRIKDVDNLLDHFDRLNGYARDIQNDLAKDLKEKQEELNAKKIDYIKNVTFPVSITLSFSVLWLAFPRYFRNRSERTYCPSFSNNLHMPRSIFLFSPISLIALIMASPRQTRSFLHF